jgi:hypothetical protein
VSVSGRTDSSQGSGGPAARPPEPPSLRMSGSRKGRRLTRHSFVAEGVSGAAEAIWNSTWRREWSALGNAEQGRAVVVAIADSFASERLRCQALPDTMSGWS